MNPATACRVSPWGSTLTARTRTRVLSGPSAARAPLSRTAVSGQASGQCVYRKVRRTAFPRRCDNSTVWPSWSRRAKLGARRGFLIVGPSNAGAAAFAADGMKMVRAAATTAALVRLDHAFTGLVDDDRPVHVRVDDAFIVVRAGLGEGHLEHLRARRRRGALRLQDARIEVAIAVVGTVVFHRASGRIARKRAQRV